MTHRLSPHIFGDVTKHPLPFLIGIVNATPDSFYDGGKYNTTIKGAKHGLRLLDEGADILDIGGESTRPPGKDYGAGSIGVSLSEELDRVIPVIEEITGRHPETLLSIDTMKPEVADAALRAGATIINDVSGGQYDEEIWDVAAEHDAPYILMHGHNPHSRSTVDSIHYNDVVRAVYQFLAERINLARDRGVQQIIADPGIGFAKGADDSMKIIRQMSDFRSLEVPLLIGASRKSFIGRELGGLPPDERLFGTLAAHAAAVIGGATFIRVHDVRPAVEFFGIFRSLFNISTTFTEGFSKRDPHSLSSSEKID